MKRLKLNRFGGASSRAQSTVVHVPQEYGEPPSLIDSCVIRSNTPNTTKPRVLCFTPSCDRPEHLVRCILQIQQQTYLADHSIFINTKDINEKKNYIKLVQQLVHKPKSNIYLAFGQSKRQHENYTNAIKVAPIERYHLFLKIDDDDYYSDEYVQLCVEDFVSKGWDFSGCRSHGYVINNDYHHLRTLLSLGEGTKDVALGVPPLMPPTYAFSAKAISSVLQIKDDGINFEDQQWRWALASDSKIRIAIRKHDGFIYNIHGSNFSKPVARSAEPDQSKHFITAGIITSGREIDTCTSTMEALVKDGFKLRIYAEPDANFKPVDGTQLALRNTKHLGPLGNTYSALSHMVQTAPNSKYYAVFQDDIDFTAGLHDWIQGEPWPNGAEVISLYTMRHYLNDEPGWKMMDLGYYRTFGGLAFVFTNQAANKFVKSDYVRQKVRTQKTGIDAVVGQWASDTFGGIAYHSPSLIKQLPVKSTLRSWRFGGLVSTEIPPSIEVLPEWSMNKPEPKIGLVGWNTAQGLGFMNRDIAQHLPIHRWIIPRHPKFHELDDTCGCASVHVTTDIEPDAVRDLLSGLDWVMFCELAYIKNFAGISRSCGIPNVCIPMWEWLHQGLDWLKYIDIFLCPTKACYDMLMKWRSELDLRWDVYYMPWPIDLNRFQFRERNICETFLFNNGTGGARPKDQSGGFHGPRKGLDVVLAAARNLPDIPFVIRSQVEIHGASKNVKLIGAVEDNAELYDIGDVSIQPSRCEGLGLQLLESQACGVPIITTNAPPMNEHNPIHTIKCSAMKGRFLGERWMDIYEPNVRALCGILSSLHGQEITEHSHASREFVEGKHNWDTQREFIMNLLTK